MPHQFLVFLRRCTRWANSWALDHPVLTSLYIAAVFFFHTARSPSLCPIPNLEDQALYLWLLVTGWSRYTPRYRGGSLFLDFHVPQGCDGCILTHVDTERDCSIKDYYFLCECEAWFHSLRKEHSPRVFENTWADYITRGGVGVTDPRWKLDSKGLNNVHYSQNVIDAIKWRRVFPIVDRVQTLHTF